MKHIQSTITLMAIFLLIAMASFVVAAEEDSTAANEPEVHPIDTVNALIGNRGAEFILERRGLDRASVSDNEFARAHVAYAVELLRNETAKKATASDDGEVVLTEHQLKIRTHLLDRMGEYLNRDDLQGNPTNKHKACACSNDAEKNCKNRLPRMQDVDDRHDPRLDIVGFLFHHSAGQHVIDELIERGHEYSFVSEFLKSNVVTLTDENGDNEQSSIPQEDRLIDQVLMWLETHGFTAQDLALLQPTYAYSA